VYGIITQSGGWAHIYSEPGLGVAITALFPATERTAPTPDRSTAPRVTGGGETVLIVEDEDGMRDVTERILARNGYRVLSAASGTAAIELIENHPGQIDLLLTDVVMPQMLGKEVSERVRAFQPAVRVLYMSGYALPVLGAQGTLDAGVTLVEKPFTAPVLLAKVKEVLERPASDISQ
jgi:CheY-like chemotaxis protein